jgi:hypothetical protein
MACATIGAVRRRVLAAVMIAIPACGGGGSPPAPAASVATVTFVYSATTVRRAGLPTDCADFVGPTHIHPSWRGFAVTPLSAGADRWEVSLADVPVDSLQQVRVNDVNACSENSTGYVLRNVTANGVALTTVVPGNPGSGTGFASDPGLSFTVNARGQVSP